MRASDPLASVVGEVSAWGPFFTVHTHAAATAPHPPWRPMRDLVDDPAVLAGRVDAIRSYLAAAGDQPVDRIAVRVAASVTQLGLAARLISPVLGFALHSGLFPSLMWDDLWWQPELGSMFPLSVGLRGGGTPAELIAGPLSDLVRAMRPFSVSERVLWGNVASAINGAVTMIGTARPELTTRAAALVAELSDLPSLRHTGVRHPDGRFQRRSCCLIYQVSPTNGHQTICGDCVLNNRR